MKTLVLGGTGTVGSQVVSALLKRNTEVSVLTRNDENLHTLPKGVRGILGDLMNPHTIRNAFAGHDAVFLLNAVSATECHEGIMAVNGARQAGVKKLVYLSVPQTNSAAHLPHFGAKIGVEAAVQQSGIEYTILRPNNFFQNDYWIKDALLQYGVFASPIGGKGLSRIDVRDIAELAAIVLTEPGHDGKIYPVHGPDVLGGEDCARIWSEALGREIAYPGDDLDSWEQQSLAFMPDWMVFDLRLMLEFFQENGFRGSDQEISELTSLLGHAPRKFADFAQETAAFWQET